MRTQQTVLCIEGYNQTTVPAGTIKKKHCGRPAYFLTASEIQECLKYFYISKIERESLLDRFGKKKIMNSRSIFRLDFGKQGRIFRCVCSEHGRAALTYGWSNSEGVRVRCIVPNCHKLNTHFEPNLFHTAMTEKEENISL